MFLYLLSVITSAVVAIVSVFTVYNYLPLEKLEFVNPRLTRLGATITNIAGTDTISGSRTTINDNFTNLNNGKIENSTSSVAAITTLANLVTIGTITSGTWTGSTIGVAYGGTGSSTLSSNRVLLGNGTSAMRVATTGTDGQLLGLTNGVPTWQSTSVDQTSNYLWTGGHRFAIGATTTILVASSTVANPLILNTISYNTPSSQGASSTVLANDGSGGLRWIVPDWVLLGEQILSSANATSTVTIAGSHLDLKIIFYTPGVSGEVEPRITFNTDYAGANTNYASRTFEGYVLLGGGSVVNTAYGNLMGAATTVARYIELKISNNSANNKLGTYTGLTDVVLPTVYSGTLRWVNTTAQITTINIVVSNIAQTWNAGTRLSVYGKAY